MRTHFDELKGLHLCMCSSSEFPGTTLNDFAAFARKARLVDKAITLAVIERLFTAANAAEGEQGDNRAKSLIRYEFMELLVRIAKEKYHKTRVAASVADAFEMLLERDVLPVSNHEEWQGFRDNVLYTVDVDRALRANQEALGKLYRL